jgi:hypothetical protein
MRNLIFIKICILLTTNSFSKEESKDMQEIKDIKSAVEQVQVLEDAKQGPNNSINYQCQDCIKDKDIKDAVVIDSEEINLERIMFNTGKRDNRLVIKIDKNSPDKFKIKYKEKHRGCKKYISHKNPLSGQIGFSCLIPSYNKRDDSITIDISDRKRSADGEYIEIELVKLASDSTGFVNARFREQTGKRISSDRGAKFLFFGTKYNLK